MGGTTPQVTLAGAPEVLPVPVPKPCMGRGYSAVPQTSSTHLGTGNGAAKLQRATFGSAELGKGQWWEVAAAVAAVVMVVVTAVAIPATAVAPVVDGVAVVAVMAVAAVVTTVAAVAAVAAGCWWQ